MYHWCSVALCPWMYPRVFLSVLPLARVASFLFSKRSNSAIVIFIVFWDFMQHFLRNAMSENAEISRIGLPISH